MINLAVGCIAYYYYQSNNSKTKLLIKAEEYKKIKDEEVTNLHYIISEDSEINAILNEPIKKA